jgi:hypothetical protein
MFWLKLTCQSLTNAPLEPPDPPQSPVAEPMSTISTSNRSHDEVPDLGIISPGDELGPQPPLKKPHPVRIMLAKIKEKIHTKMVDYWTEPKGKILPPVVQAVTTLCNPVRKVLTSPKVVSVTRTVWGKSKRGLLAVLACLLLTCITLSQNGTLPLDAVRMEPDFTRLDKIIQPSDQRKLVVNAVTTSTPLENLENPGEHTPGFTDKLREDKPVLWDEALRTFHAEDVWDSEQQHYLWSMNWFENLLTRYDEVTDDGFQEAGNLMLRYQDLGKPVDFRQGPLPAYSNDTVKGAFREPRANKEDPVCGQPGQKGHHGHRN